MKSLCRTFLAFWSVIGASAFRQTLDRDCHRFRPPHLSFSSAAAASRQHRCRQSVILFAEEPKEETEAVDESSSSEPASAPVSVEEEEAKYPINLPSPILLSTAMVLAIASTGSIFELIGNKPTLGFAPTAAIAAIGFPLALFLFYASILKAQAETEEDDKRYLSGK